jgi:hypothetical protein
MALCPRWTHAIAAGPGSARRIRRVAVGADFSLPCRAKAGCCGPFHRDCVGSVPAGRGSRTASRAARSQGSGSVGLDGGPYRHVLEGAKGVGPPRAPNPCFLGTEPGVVTRPIPPEPVEAPGPPSREPHGTSGSRTQAAVSHVAHLDPALGPEAHCAGGAEEGEVRPGEAEVLPVVIWLIALARRPNRPGRRTGRVSPPFPAPQ